jgi:hypothetical protein
MECYVDAGPIVKVRGVTPRDCLHLALAELGPRAKSPVTVHLPIGDQEVYIVEDGRVVGTLGDLPDPETVQADNQAWQEEAWGDQLVQRCAVCGCTDLEPCSGGCYWLHLTDGPLNLCSRCGGC